MRSFSAARVRSSSNRSLAVEVDSFLGEDVAESPGSSSLALADGVFGKDVEGIFGSGIAENSRALHLDEENVSGLNSELFAKRLGNENAALLVYSGVPNTFPMTLVLLLLADPRPSRVGNPHSLRLRARWGCVNALDRRTTLLLFRCGLVDEPCLSFGPMPPRGFP